MSKMYSHKQVIDNWDKGKKVRNWKDEGRLLVTLYDCLWPLAHDKCINSDKNEVGYRQIDAKMSEKYGFCSKWLLQKQTENPKSEVYEGTSPGTKKEVSPDIFGSQSL